MKETFVSHLCALGMTRRWPRSGSSHNHCTCRVFRLYGPSSAGPCEPFFMKVLGQTVGWERGMELEADPLEGRKGLLLYL